MAFGKRKSQELSNAEAIDSESDPSSESERPTPALEQVENLTSSSSKEPAPHRKESINVKPLLSEVTLMGTTSTTNPGGSKTWKCNPCSKFFTSSYTRIHFHFFGAPCGKKAGIQRCSILIKNREEYDRVRRMVQNAEKSGVSPALKCSTIRKSNTNKQEASNTIAEAFRVMDRADVDLKVMRGLCANEIPFNVLRNPHFVEMVTAINNAPKGIYARPEAKIDAVTMDAIDWWSTYGSETPELAEVAKKVLSQPVSSSSSERAWSTYSYIHNVKRNRLTCSRADKLVFIHYNIRLQSRFCESYKHGYYKKWDMDPDDTYFEESSARLGQMRWESDDYGETQEEEELEQRKTNRKMLEAIIRKGKKKI